MLYIKSQKRLRQVFLGLFLISFMLIGSKQVSAQLCEEEDCVMPGDTDYDGKADAWDLLRLGVSYGMSGPARPNVSTEWEPQEGQDWPMDQYDGTNYKHVDCNGDGLVTVEDIDAISNNYYEEKSFICNSDPNANYLLSIDITNETISEGQPIQANIKLTSKDGSPVEDVHGIAFRVVFEDNLITDNSIEMSYDDSWLGESYELLTIQKEFFNRVDVGAARMIQGMANGDGDIITFSAIMEEIILGEALVLDLKLEDVRLIDNNGNPHPVDVQNAAKTIEYTTGLEKLTTDNGNLTIFPNPSINNINLRMDSYLEALHVEIIDINGKTVKTVNLPESKENTFDLEVTDLFTGIYFVKVVVKGGILQHSLIISR